MDVNWYGSLNDVVDYFHFNRICTELGMQNDTEELQRVLSRQNVAYPKSPLSLVIDMQNSIASKDYVSAFDASAELSVRFPNNYDYAFNFAYCAFKAGYYPKAVEVLKDLNVETSQSDVDVLSLLGHAQLEEFFKNGKEELSFEAKSSLDKAIKLCNEQGYPATYPAGQLARLYEKSSFKPAPSGKCWLVELSAKQFYWFRTAAQAEITTLKKALGNKVKKGDMVLFVRKEKSSSSDVSTVNIGGLLSVMSDPEWHPIENFESILRLENRPEIVIKFEVTEDAEKIDINNLDLGDSRRYGALELTSEAQNYIDEVISEYSNELSQFTTTYQDLRAAK